MSLLVRFVPILASFFVFASAQCAFDSLSAYSPELGKCYYRNIRTALDWMSAEQLCVDNNWGHLATVDNAFASNIVFSNRFEVNSFQMFIYLELLSAANVTNAWIGAHRNPNGNNYVWVDGSAWNYMNWANGIY
jgi:prepilin-type processing-associated H-X9-DG protein